MNYKRHWDYTKEGLTKLFETKNSACHTMEAYGLMLKAGNTYEGNTGAMEYGITILTGTCDVTGEGFAFLAAGGRQHVLDANGTVIYIPKETAFTVKASTDLRIIITACPAEKHYDPYIVKPEDAIVKTFGKPGFQREAHFMLDERFPANRVYIGENHITGNQWTGFPGHKHDETLGKEVFAEEIYYFEFDKPTGYGIQQVYTADRLIDEAYTTRDGDIIEIPKGYHPGTVAPGYTCYMLWLMSCDAPRGLNSSSDPEQVWQVQ